LTLNNEQERQQMEKWPIGVFAGIDAGLGVQLEVAQELGVPTIQLHTPTAAMRTPAAAEAFLARLADAGITLTCVFGGFEGESYASIQASQETVGLVPAATRAARLAEMKEISDFTKLLGCNVVALHLGFIPHDVESPVFREVTAVTQELCDHVKANGQNLHLETGQESADGLLAFHQAVGRDNLFVNFDPANMILYGTGEPIEAVKKLGPLVRSVHCKDGTWAENPGKEWGCEVPFGDGDVNAGAFLAALLEIGYDGPLTIEREIPQEPARQKAEIGLAVERISTLKAELL
jgi:sugar phosphate isomerase/epimerase